MESSPSKAQLIAAFGAVYLIWGSTYLAIRFAVETIPPFLMVAARFLVAGAFLYLWAIWQSKERPTLKHWFSASVVGFLLLVAGNGSVAWAEQTVPSGITALIIAIVPLWMVLFDWIGSGIRPNTSTIVGVLLGMLGILILVGPGELTGSEVDPIGGIVLIAATISWAYGSLHSRKAVLPKSPLLATAMEMLAAGVFLALIGLGTHEGSGLDVSSITTVSLVSLGYLIFFGSMVGFTAYIWILRVAPPSKVATYAFVNPVVAVFLGWALANEPLTLNVLVASAVIVAGVATIIFTRDKTQVPEQKSAEPVVDRVNSSKEGLQEAIPCK
ncbi:MAG TPA: EamA family transporter [Bacteroidota bacterium]|nr:EamA family transporter [Bacteroidota bacterium]